MTTNQFHSLGGAFVRLLRQSDDVADVLYVGSLNGETFPELFRRACLSAKGASRLIIRADDAIIHDKSLLIDSISGAAVRSNAAVITSPGNFEVWQAYAQEAARHGVQRAIFTTGQESLARWWVLAQ